MIRISLAVAALAAACNGVAASLTADLQKRVRVATFEVVIPKPQKEVLTYEKPLPLELLPFTERNDKYWSIGTAVSLGPNVFASAGHVMLSGVGSQFGMPAIRDSEGKVYPVDRVLKFSAHEDYMVFTVVNPPVVASLDTNSATTIDDTVYAVGNALGEGVIIRDGLLTSFTPEDQDGRWKWLRFSAAASPGNSGGPLLDVEGRVIGIIVAKSPNENLNYALPIERISNGAASAIFDTRESFALPILQGATVARIASEFELPLSYDEFARRVLQIWLKYYREQQDKLLAEHAAELFPHGNSTKVLATLHESFEPRLVIQQADKSWEVESASRKEKTDLEGNGRVWTGAVAETTLFRIQFPNRLADAHRYDDAKAFMDLLLKGLNLPRIVGPQAVRITSLGPAQTDTPLRDHFGRVWQVRVWSLGYADLYVLAFALPTPDGYVGMLKLAAHGLRDVSIEQAKLLADYFYVSYAGSLPQWRSFLGRRDLRPAAFERIELEAVAGKPVRYKSPRLQLELPLALVRHGDDSGLQLHMAYILDDGRLNWDVGGIVLTQDRREETYVAAYRQPRPEEGADDELMDRWERMLKHEREFSGVPDHDSKFEQFWIRAAAPLEIAAQSPPRLMYEVVYSTQQSLLPRDLMDLQPQLLNNVRVLEK